MSTLTKHLISGHGQQNARMLFKCWPTMILKLDCDAWVLQVFPNGDERPIAYASRTLSANECNYSQIEALLQLSKNSTNISISVEISQLLLWTWNDERFSFLTTLAYLMFQLYALVLEDNLSDISTRCSSPRGLQHLVNMSDKLLSTKVVKKENLWSLLWPCHWPTTILAKIPTCHRPLTYLWTLAHASSCLNSTMGQPTIRLQPWGEVSLNYLWVSIDYRRHNETQFYHEWSILNLCHFFTRGLS